MVERKAILQLGKIVVSSGENCETNIAENNAVLYFCLGELTDSVKEERKHKPKDIICLFGSNQALRTF